MDDFILRLILDGPPVLTLPEVVPVLINSAWQFVQDWWVPALVGAWVGWVTWR
jgi:hypothetical protein